MSRIRTGADGAVTRGALVVLASLTLLSAAPAHARFQLFRRGDLSGDGALGLDDVAFTLRLLLEPGVRTECIARADANDDGRFDIADPVRMLEHIFRGGSPLPPPFAECGFDPTADSLPCPLPACRSSAHCLDDSVLSGIVAGAAPEFTYCYPAGFTEISLAGVNITLCPESAAAPCPLAGAGDNTRPGYVVAADSVSGIVRASERALVLRIEGWVDDLPVAVLDPVDGEMTACTVDVRGASEDEPFRIDVTFPVLGEEIQPGVLVVFGLGDATAVSYEAEITAEGGERCRPLADADTLAVDFILGELEGRASELAIFLQEALAGLALCEVPARERAVRR